AELSPWVDGDVLRYPCNAELAFRIGGVAARARVSWMLSTPPGAGDAQASVVRGTRSDVLMERTAQTGYRRRLLVQPHGDRGRARQFLTEMVAGLQREFPGVGVAAAEPGRYEITIPSALDGGHESQFARVLDDLLTLVEQGAWPAALAERTLAKYTLLAEAA